MSIVDRVLDWATKASAGLIFLIFVMSQSSPSTRTAGGLLTLVLIVLWLTVAARWVLRRMGAWPAPVVKPGAVAEPDPNVWQPPDMDKVTAALREPPPEERR